MKSPLPAKHWSRKFRNAFRGLRVGVHRQSSFWVHFTLTVLVFGVAVCLRVSPLEWCVLLLCIGSVLTAEFFNSELESCAKAITNDFDDHIRDALDIASAAVLVASVVAAIVGASIFIFRVGFI